MIYIWDIPDEYPEVLIGEYNREKSPDRFTLCEGTPVPNCGSAVVNFNCSLCDIANYDVLPNSSMLPLLNTKVQELLWTMAPDQCQFIDTIVETKNGISDAYSILVATKKQVLLDRNKSKFTYVLGTDAIMGFDKLRYKSEDFRYNLARDAEYLSHLLISDQLRGAFLKARITGITFIRPEDLFP